MNTKAHKQAIALAIQAINTAHAVYILLHPRYYDSVYGEYVRITKLQARRIVRMLPEESEPFKFKWEGRVLYLPPAWNPDAPAYS